MDETAERTDRTRLRGLLESDLRRFSPDLEVVDRGLLLSRGAARTPGGRRADLVFLDGEGSALIAIVVDGRRDESVQAAVDALVFARDYAQTLAMLRTTGRDWPPVGARARVAIVAESFSEKCLAALALFPADELWVLEARRFESETGTRHILVPLTRPPILSEPGDRKRHAFLAQVPEPLRGPAEALLRRLVRVEPGAQTTFENGRASVRAGAREIGALEIQDGRLEAEAAALEGPRPIEGPSDAETFLDDLLREELRGPGARREDGPLLTPEEIAAFRD